MDIAAATKSYESWLAKLIPLYQPDLKYKHERMAGPNSFPFFRGTYYRWAQLWANVAGHIVAAPTVLAVGDLHVENFGTWRDADGRLCWGVNDFDEVDRLPFTNDLVRLAASLRFATWSPGLNIKFSASCKTILSGYQEALEAGGTPFVLEENYPGLRALAMSKERDPVVFWAKLTKVLDDKPANPPKAVRTALAGALADQGVSPQYRIRPRVGMGSLGKSRYVALAQAHGGWLAREAKSATPPATAWVAGKTGGDASLAFKAVRQALRSPDPFYRLAQGWVIRRLGPRCSRIELANLKNAKDTDLLLHSMGAEAANVHLGTPGARQDIKKALTHLPKNWLEDAARNLARLIVQDWGDWQRAVNKKQK
jgi:hypothetical protein